jgi:hypothetical protein
MLREPCLKAEPQLLQDRHKGEAMRRFAVHSCVQPQRRHGARSKSQDLVFHGFDAPSVASRTCGLTFELSGRQRCGALGLRRKIGRRPGAAGPVCHAVGAQLERGVRHHSALFGRHWLARSFRLARRAVSSMRLVRVDGVLAVETHSRMPRLAERGNALKLCVASG